MRASVLAWVLAAALCQTGPATAITLRICQDVRSHAPLMTADGTGVVDQIIRLAAREAGFDIDAYAAPAPRCKEEIRVGLAQAFPMAPFNAESAGIAAYPMRQGQIDLTRQTATVRMMGLRRTGDAVSWDGKRMLERRGPLLANSATLAPPMIAKMLGAPIDMAAPTTIQNIEKMLAGRGGLVLGWEGDLVPMLTRPEFAGRIELLDKPLAELPMFVPIGRAFYQAHAEQTERFWSAVAALARTSPHKENLAEAVRNWRGE